MAQTLLAEGSSYMGISPGDRALIKSHSLQKNRTCLNCPVQEGTIVMAASTHCTQMIHYALVQAVYEHRCI